MSCEIIHFVSLSLPQLVFSTCPSFLSFLLLLAVCVCVFMCVCFPWSEPKSLSQPMLGIAPALPLNGYIVLVSSLTHKRKREREKKKENKR